MPKQGKSSATSATRKKHARKAAEADGSTVNKDGQSNVKVKKGDKKDKKETAKKVYIPPMRPKPSHPDPLDTLGLASVLPAELVVLLRRFAKKDTTTKVKALEEFQNLYLERTELDIDTLVIISPIWIHHYPSLIMHPFRRLRALASIIHVALRKVDAIDRALTSYLLETGEEAQVEPMLGASCMAAFDEDRHIASASRTNLDFIQANPSESVIQSIEIFLDKVLFDPVDLYLQIYGPRPVDAGGTTEQTGDDFEDMPSRFARWRGNGIRVITWLLGSDKLFPLVNEWIQETLKRSALWSSLQPAKKSNENTDVFEASGAGFPRVRTAVWNMLRVILELHPALINGSIERIATSVLMNAWIEPDQLVRGAIWKPLLLFLTTHSEAWYASSSEDEEGDQREDAERADHTDNAGGNNIGKPAYGRFLSFIAHSCWGSYNDGYSTILVVLSTVPRDILPMGCEHLAEFFNAFKSAHENGYLITPVASCAFLSAYLECIIYISKALKRAEFLDEVCEAVVTAQWSFIWNVLVSNQLVINKTDATRIVAKSLETLETVDEIAFKMAWSPLISLSADGIVDQNLKTALPLFNGLWIELSNASLTKTSLNALVHGRIEESLNKLIIELEENKIPIKTVPNHFELWISDFYTVVVGDQKLLERWHNCIDVYLPSIVSRHPKLLMDHLTRLTDSQALSYQWNRMLEIMNDLYCQNLEQYAYAALDNALGALNSGKLSSDHLRPYREFLSDILDGLYTDSLADDTEARIHLVRLLSRNECFTARGSTIIGSLIDVVRSQFNEAVYTVNTPFMNMKPGLQLIHDLCIERRSLIQDYANSCSLVPVLYFLAFLGETDAVKDIASRIWDHFKMAQMINSRTIVQPLQDWIADPQSSVSIVQITNALLENEGALSINPLEDALVEESTLDLAFTSLPRASGTSALGVIDPLLAEDSTTTSPGNIAYDDLGFSSYARGVYLALTWCKMHRSSLQKHPLILRHIMLTARQASDLLALPSCYRPIFNGSARSLLQSIVSKTEEICVAFFNSEFDIVWHKRCVSVLLGQTSISLDLWGKHLQACFRRCASSSSAQNPWALYLTLKHVISGSPSDASEVWLAFARKISLSSPETARYIFCAVTRFGSHCSQLDRLRNQIAGDITSIHASYASTRGLVQLVQLIALAPDIDGEDALIGVQRAVFLVQHFEKWALDHEDGLTQETQGFITAILLHLVPLLQGVKGGHWEFICDLLESNLKECSLQEESSLFKLSYSLNLLLLLEEFSTSNNTVRQYWEPRRNSATKLVLDLLITPQDLPFSEPLEHCQKLALRAAQLVPNATLKPEQLESISTWLVHPDIEVLTFAHPILQKLSQIHTESTAMHFAIDVKESNPIFPEFMMRLILRQPATFADLPSSSWISSFGYLLAWMSTLDLLSNASYRVKKSYLSDLQGRNVLGHTFIPFLLDTLDISSTGKSSFRLDLWQLDEYYVNSTCSPAEGPSVELLAAHVLYRMLSICPMLVRSWWLECTDRKLNSLVSSFITTHYSPSLIQQELRVLQDENVLKEISVENFTLRVMPALKEIHSVYAIDDHNMEVVLKLPDDFPLHGVTVQGVQKVGVSDEKWRAWLLGLQQVVNSQNGQIREGIQIFGKNVSLHFEGQAECAICYSIISVSDRKLPTTPCKTCKNRFHASCLYKWFETSHSSACPLCRSEII